MGSWLSGMKIMWWSIVHNNKHRYKEGITRGAPNNLERVTWYLYQGNQSSGPLSLSPTKAGEALLEAAKQAERAGVRLPFPPKVG